MSDGRIFFFFFAEEEFTLYLFMPSGLFVLINL